MPAKKATTKKPSPKAAIKPLRVKKSDADRVKGGLMMGPDELQ